LTARRLTFIYLIILGSLCLTGCVRFVPPSPYILEEGETRKDDLLISSGEARLLEGATLEGSVYLLNGSLVVEPGATIDGDVAMVSGKLTLAQQAAVTQDVLLISGRLNLSEGAIIQGKTGSDLFGVLGKFLRLGLSLTFSLVCLAVILVGGLVALIVWLRRRKKPAKPSEALSLESLTQTNPNHS
jgi:hypothetical protein